MTGLDQLESSLKAADPAGAGEEPEPDLILQARAIMDEPAPDLILQREAVTDRDRPARPLLHRRRRRSAIPLAAAAGTLAIGIAVAFAVLPGSEGTGLPRPVAAFAQQLDERRGVLHVRLAPDRVLPEPGLPDLPDEGWTDEVWLDLGGSGWRHVRTTPDGFPWDGRTIEQYADERGIRTVLGSQDDMPPGTIISEDPVPPEDLRPDYLRNPGLDGVLAEPLELVRSGQLEIVGDETINGRPAYVVAVRRNDPKVVPDTGDGVGDVRIYIAKDDGDLLRTQYRTREGLTEEETAMRTRVQDYPVYEILPPTPENLALIRPPAGR